jgi:hypothetical protein
LESEVDARNCTHGAVNGNKVAQRTLIADAIPRSKNSLSLAEPRDFPAESDGRRPVIKVVALEIDGLFGMGRILSYKLHLGQICTRARKPDRSRTGGAGHTRQCTLIIADNSSIEPARLKWLAIVLPVNPKVQSEVGTEFPIVFEIRAYFALILPVILDWNCRRTRQSCVRRTGNSKRLIDLSDGSGQVR